MVPILYIDRDGVLLREPPMTEQVDSLESFSLMPGVISGLKQIVTHTNYELVMVTNQDGLGTTSFPEETFWPYQNLLLEILQSEGIQFSSVHIDRSFPKDNLPTRKPGTAMLSHYLNNPNYDLANSIVIGDRLSDVELANNLGCGAILFQEKPVEHISQSMENSLIMTTNSWSSIANFLTDTPTIPPRTAQVVRNTKETKIDLHLNIDGRGEGSVDTGIPFFDHMLDQLIRHGQFDMNLKVVGDLEVDNHHTIEDTAIALGTAFAEALGDKRGIARYGACLPMDEARGEVLIDFCSRPYLVYDLPLKNPVGGIDGDMFYHFFKSFSDAAQCTLHVQGRGRNGHHKIEIVYKAFAHALRRGVKRNLQDLRLLTTKGSL